MFPLSFLLLILLVCPGDAFNGITRFRGITLRKLSTLAALTQDKVDEYTKVPSSFRPSITDKARTITHVCTTGTLCTTSMVEGVEGYPFGSYVDFVSDENGCPIMLLSNQSVHTNNIQHNPRVSLFCQLPRQMPNQATAALSRVTVMGEVAPVPEEEKAALQMAFTVLHPYAEQIIDSPKFRLFRLRPQKIYFSGGFGVMATWLDVAEYAQARADVLAAEVPSVLSRVNLEKQGELLLLCKHFLGLTDVSSVRVQAIDRLGIDLRVKIGELTDEYRVGFRHEVNSSEDAKSEMVKLFQEAWEREQGLFFTDDLPPITKYAEDIIRSDGRREIRTKEAAEVIGSGSGSGSGSGGAGTGGAGARRRS